jgi:hypothetical protein
MLLKQRAEVVEKAITTPTQALASDILAQLTLALCALWLLTRVRRIDVALRKLRHCKGHS